MLRLQEITKEVKCKHWLGTVNGVCVTCGVRLQVHVQRKFSKKLRRLLGVDDYDPRMIVKTIRFEFQSLDKKIGFDKEKLIKKLEEVKIK